MRAFHVTVRVPRLPHETLSGVAERYGGTPGATPAETAAILDSILDRTEAHVNVMLPMFCRAHLVLTDWRDGAGLQCEFEYVVSPTAVRVAKRLAEMLPPPDEGEEGPECEPEDDGLVKLYLYTALERAVTLEEFEGLVQQVLASYLLYSPLPDDPSETSAP